MSWLPYCVFLWPEDELAATPTGVGGQPVRVVSQAGLGAAVSLLPAGEPHPNISDVLAFEQVVEWFDAQRGVLPMRYGCFLEDLAQVRELLAAHREEYRERLEELDGGVEMTIRLLPGTAPGSGPDPAPPEGCRTGAAYLVWRKDRYAAAELAARQAEGSVERLCGLLGGTFVRSRREPARRADPAGGPTLASVHFLLKRGGVAAFREAVARIRGRLPGRVLLSGPWPPYNFVELGPAEEAREPAGGPPGEPAQV